MEKMRKSKLEKRCALEGIDDAYWLFVNQLLRIQEKIRMEKLGLEQTEIPMKINGGWNVCQ